MPEELEGASPVTEYRIYAPGGIGVASSEPHLLAEA